MVDDKKLNIDAIVCPKQKLVKIVIPRNKGKHAVLKTYRFKQDIPLLIELKQKQDTIIEYGAFRTGIMNTMYQLESMTNR